MTLNQLAQEAHELAIEKGWYDNDRSFPELIALCHSELSEALEEYRSRPADYCTRCAGHHVFIDPETNKPSGIPIELADLIIRVADLAGFYGIDLDTAVRLKMSYNRTRPYRHGGKLA